MEQQGQPQIDAFVSYSHATDGDIAPAIQRALSRFGRSWFQRAAVYVFRDETDLSAEPALWSAIEAALTRSRHFILLCSPEAAHSKWVAKEIDHFVARGDGSKIILVLTDGTITWSPNDRDFDWSTTTLPRRLEKAFDDEPLHVDLRWARASDDLTLRNSHFADNIASILAAVTSRPKKDLIGDDVRIQRRARRITWTALVMLAVLLIAVSAAALLAVRERAVAVREESAAVAVARIALGRQLAAQSELIRTSQGGLIQRAVLLALESTRLAPAFESTQALSDGTALLPASLGRIPLPSDVKGFAIDPAGKQAAYYLERNPFVTVVDLASGQSAQLLHFGWASAVAFDPSAPVIATGGADGMVKLWGLHNFREREEARVGGTVEAIAYRKDGHLLAVYSAGTPDGHPPESDNGTLYVWSIDNTGGVQDQLMRIRDKCHATALSFHPTRPWIAITCGKIKIYDYLSGSLIQESESLYGIASCAFSPDGNYMATSNLDGTVLVSSLDSDPRRHIELELGELGYHHGDGEIAFSADSQLIVFAGSDQVIRIWELKTSTELAQIEGRLFAVLPDRENLAVMGKMLTLLHWKNKPFHMATDERLLSGLFAGGTKVIMHSDKQLLISSTTPGDASHRIEYGQDERIISVCPRKMLVAVGTAKSLVAVEQATSARTQQTILKHLSDKEPKRQQTISYGVFTEDCSLLVTASEDWLWFWNVDTGMLLAQRPSVGEIESITLSSSRRALIVVRRGASSEHDETRVLVWDIDNGNTLNDVAVPTTIDSHVIESHAFTDTGDHFVISMEATIFAPGGVAVWETGKAEPIAVLEQKAGSSVVKFSHDGKTLGIARSDGRIDLWDVLRQVTRGQLQDDGWPHDIAFDTSDAYLASGGDGRTTRVWELASEREVARLTYEDIVYSVAFSPDGHQILSQLKHGSIAISKWQTPDLVDEACHRLTRNLTLEEWLTYLPSEPYHRTCPDLP